MESLLERLESETPSELRERSLESLRFFQQRVRNLKLTAEGFYRQSDLNKANKLLEGRMYTFFYDAKTKKKLPYWDRFPLVILLELRQDGFTGLNLHYIPPRYRVKFLYELYKYVVFDDDAMAEEEMRMRIKMTYSLLTGISKLKSFKPCFKRYLTTQMEGRALEITPNYWDTMAMLPLAQFQKENVRTVYSDSIRKINS
tara:strand:+ start:20 stop:619 length:600 start_codon:yes stop_codon:yes gene_type:complete